MSLIRRPNRRTARKALKWTIGGIVAAQAAAVAAVMAVDEHRKRRNPPTDEFPTMEPRTVDVAGSDLTVYTFGEDLYEDMLAAIEAAEEEIFFEIFIMKADDVGYRFRDALIAAAKRGVKVYIIIDTFGNLNQDPRFRRFPDIPGLHVIRFPLIRTGLFTGKGKDRGLDHRKILVVDKTVGFVGGFNIGELYAQKWRDTHLRIVGPATWELENAFTDMWDVYRKPHHPVLIDRGKPTWTAQIAAVLNVPAFKLYPVRAMYLSAIDRADQRVWISMGYFIPDFAMIHSLKAAARRGVDVRVLVPHYSNHIVTDWVGRPHYTELLIAGVRIFRYEEAMIHAKTMTVDGVWSTVGTTNFDRLSMAGNFEINMEIYDEEFAELMEDVFRLDLSNSHELLPEEWAQRGRLARITERILKPLGPLL